MSDKTTCWLALTRFGQNRCKLHCGSGPSAGSTNGSGWSSAASCCCCSSTSAALTETSTSAPMLRAWRCRQCQRATLTTSSCSRPHWWQRSGCAGSRRWVWWSVSAATCTCSSGARPWSSRTCRTRTTTSPRPRRRTLRKWCFRTASWWLSLVFEIKNITWGFLNLKPSGTLENFESNTNLDWKRCFDYFDEDWSDSFKRVCPARWILSQKDFFPPLLLTDAVVVAAVAQKLTNNLSRIRTHLSILDGNCYFSIHS